MKQKNFKAEQELLNDPELEKVLIELLRLPDQNTKVSTGWFSSGWLEIEHKSDGSVDVWKRSDKEHHNLRAGPARCITITNDARLVSMMETALSLWMIWNTNIYGREKHLLRAIEFAKHVHKHLVK